MPFTGGLARGKGFLSKGTLKVQSEAGHDCQALVTFDRGHSHRASHASGQKSLRGRCENCGQYEASVCPDAAPHMTSSCDGIVYEPQMVLLSASITSKPVPITKKFPESSCHA
jgi:hypothetical protein